MSSLRSLLHQAVEDPLAMVRVIKVLPSPICLSQPIPAAVLVLFQNEHIILTKRASHLTVHAGQISCPGGAWETQDKTLEETALRECFEEVGIPPSQVQPIAALPHLDVPTGFRIYPILAELLSQDVSMSPNADEVEQVVFLPIQHALSLDTYRWEQHLPTTIQDDHVSPRGFWSLQNQGNYIWGATALILHRLAWLCAMADKTGGV